MYKDTFWGKLRINSSNVLGWSTKRKIIVIELDDWGSIRTFNKEAYDLMNRKGLNIAKNHYGFDSLESNNDLENLFEVLSKFKDSTGRSVVLTPICNMANPDFNKIEASNFQTYYYESLDKTIIQYNNHDKLLNLWREGENLRLFTPQLHGREHINIKRWMSMLNKGYEGIKYAFSLNSVGISAYKNESYMNYLGALNPIEKNEITELHEILKSAGDLYKHYLGHALSCFVAPNAEEPAELAATLKQIGIKTINRAKKRTYPLGDGKFKTEWNWPGKTNEYGQTILVRNAFFEPVYKSENDLKYINDWVDNCLKEIEVAFKWKKPVVISSHRVNYVGYINPENRDKGISELRRLLKTIINKWPEVEFMTSSELGDLIRES